MHTSTVPARTLPTRATIRRLQARDGRLRAAAYAIVSEPDPEVPTAYGSAEALAAYLCWQDDFHRRLGRARGRRDCHGAYRSELCWKVVRRPVIALAKAA